MRLAIMALAVANVANSGFAHADGPPTPPPVHDTVQAVKKQIEATGPSSGRWVADARKKLDKVRSIAGVSQLSEARCFRSGCYASVDYADPSVAPSTQKQLIETLRVWNLESS